MYSTYHIKPPFVHLATNEVLLDVITKNFRPPRGHKFFSTIVQLEIFYFLFYFIFLNDVVTLYMRTLHKTMYLLLNERIFFGV